MVVSSLGTSTECKLVVGLCPLWACGCGKCVLAVLHVMACIGLCSFAADGMLVMLFKGPTHRTPPL